ncbi:MAG: CCA tRNA nucleotidyltransferase [Planctomycetota bacterium]
MSLRDKAVQVVSHLRDAGFEAYLVGGCVRDMLLRTEPHDYDIATNAQPKDIKGLFDKVVEVGAEFGVSRVCIDNDWFEVAAFRTDLGYSDGRRPDAVEFTDAKGDVQRRDFTINGLLYDPLNDEVIDYVRGQDDMQNKLIRCIGDPVERFAEDKLRLLRAVRFAARLEYDIELNTLRAFPAATQTIGHVSAERIGTELLNIFTGAHADRALGLLDETRLLIRLLPEVRAMKGVEQPPKFHPEGDVYVHTKLMLGMMTYPSPELALAVLLHDVGKPPTFQETDRIRFNDHARVGANMAAKICRRLRMPNSVTEAVVELVATHMHFLDIQQMRESHLKRFMLEPCFEDALELHRLDCLASHGNLETWRWCVDRYAELEPQHVRPPRLVSGHDLIEMGYTPGPQFKKILDAVDDAQLEGELETAEQAIEFVHQRFPMTGSDEA